MSAELDPSSLDPTPRTLRSPVIRALRGAGDEVQFGSVLEAICQEPVVAQAFARAVIEHGCDGNPTARRGAERDAGTITCLGEQRLEVRVSRRMARSRAAGRVDLRFTGEKDWKLATELKLGAVFGHAQLQRYATWGPVAAVVRSRKQIEDLEQLRADDRWVGAATWGSLLPCLRELPVSSEWKHDWLALLDVMDDDGDLDETQPEPREMRDQIALMSAIAPQIFAHLTAELQKLYGVGTSEQLRLKMNKVRADRTWTSFGITGYDGAWLWLGLRNLFSRAPRIRVDYYTLPDRHAKRRLDAAHRKVERAGFLPRGDDYRYDRPHDELADVSLSAPDVVTAAFTDRLDALVRARVFDVEVDRSARRRR